MITLRGLAYCLAAPARCTIVRRLACGPYGIHRSMMTSPMEMIEKIQCNK